ncbi:MAG: A/G-specific adenine glycosylase [Pseudomonadota bacterium]
MTAAFSERLLAWFDEYGRNDLPWQHPRTRYRVWVSEIMLQQTQVTTVVGYFSKFVDRFPELRSLADAPLDDVLALWSGLGYYARARNLHKAAVIACERFGGQLPDTFDELVALPGIGRSTAGAILAQADGQRHAILDGNVKRVLARYEAIAGWPGKTQVANALWAASERYTPHDRVADYTQGIMDLGATLCTRSRPNCEACPVADTCQAFATSTVTDYPGKKPKKAKPQRHVHMLVHMRQSDSALLLARRPAEGIWGGLWSFIESDLDSDVPSGAERLPPLTHKFTHFDLHIQPWRIAQSGNEVADSDATRWFARDELSTVGVPRPVEKIVESLQFTRSLWESQA